MKRIMQRATAVAFIAGVFAAGYLLGSITQPTAHAQVGELGKAALGAASGSGGTLGAVAQLGTSITEMQEHVTALQGNIDQLEKVKAALGGGAADAAEGAAE